MSEYDSYKITAMNGDSGKAVKERLRQRGIFYHDLPAWSTAEQRIRELESRLEEEMGKNPGIPSCSGGSQKEVHKLASMLKAFEGVNAFKVVSETLHGEELTSIRHCLGKMCEQIKTEGSCRQLSEYAVGEQNRLARLAAMAQKTLCTEEKAVMLDTMIDSLGALGYQVVRKGNALKGTKMQTCIWAQADDFGGLSVDLSGFSGMACMKEKVNLENELKKRGVRLQTIDSQFHGKPEGAVLVRQLKTQFPEFKKSIGRGFPKQVHIDRILVKK